jgi:hypothetical protein
MGRGAWVWTMNGSSERLNDCSQGLRGEIHIRLRPCEVKTRRFRFCAGNEFAGLWTAVA